MSKIEPCAYFKINKAKVSYRLINQEAVILHLEKGFYYSLNKTGTLVWKLLEEGRDLEEIAKRLVKQFNINQEFVRGDIKALIADLEKEQLIFSIK